MNHDLDYSPLTPRDAFGTCRCGDWQASGTPAHVLGAFTAHVRQTSKTPQPQPAPEPAEANAQ